MVEVNFDTLLPDPESSTPKPKNRLSRFTETPPTKEEPIKEPKPTQQIDTDSELIFVGLFNGSAGSGKTRAVLEFKDIVVGDLENKARELIKYTLDPVLKAKRIGKPADMGKCDIVELLAYDPKNRKRDLIQTWENIKQFVNWFTDDGYKQFKGIAIDVAVLIRESMTEVIHQRLGRDMIQYDYRHVTAETQPLINDLILFCKENQRHCIIITHWGPEYETVVNDYGYKESRIKSWEPDVKQWMRNVVTWRLDFLRPEESGFNDKFIVYFNKAPVFQYKYMDITDKKLADIILYPTRIANEIKRFNALQTEKRLSGDKK